MLDATRKKGWIIALLVLLGASLLLWVPMVGKFSLDDPQPVAVDAARLQQDPKPYLGRRVQVEGEIGRIYGPRAFAINKPGDGGPPLLVIGDKPWSLLQRNPQVTALVRNDHVQVMGRVRRFSIGKFRERSGANGADSLLRIWDGKPIILALDLELTPGVPDMFPGAGDRRGLGGGDPAWVDLPDSLYDAALDSAFGRP